ncbi:uncharacterized protein DSM5745_04098 [Aspergillus mulundensis]|uniref:Non-haem dioxygenase N-terminal domain-containing protein n=1 Tax=Aspergillus mulundensis TaxID=1810919 RepID=A0A3D8SBN4_9EURO|nr:hypothetical protein DSM5745_04098 [Aspergillus mulundensis]RDW83772.1 hypothetical protein DSM5745_04098 [Aspergillus mulundensis]
MAITTLDFNQFRSTSAEERLKFCADLCETLSVYGFAKVRNTTLSNGLIDEIFKYARSFFALPDTIKAKAKHPEAPNPHRGWSAIGQERVWKISGFEQDQQRTDSYNEFRVCPMPSLQYEPDAGI